jgi:hypothetical protein
MGMLAGTGSTLMCDMGLGPSTLAVPASTVMSPPGVMVGTTVDMVPITNVPPFPLCSSSANPTVVAAEGAPAACLPVIPAPWVTPSTMLIDDVPALSMGATCQCAYGGTISIVGPETGVTTVP